MPSPPASGNVSTIQIFVLINNPYISHVCTPTLHCLIFVCFWTLRTWNSPNSKYSLVIPFFCSLLHVEDPSMLMDITVAVCFVLLCAVSYCVHLPQFIFLLQFWWAFGSLPCFPIITLPRWTFRCVVLPGAHLQQFLDGMVLKVGLGIPVDPKTLSGGFWGQTIFIIMLKYYLPFSLPFSHKCAFGKSAQLRDSVIFQMTDAQCYRVTHG